MERKRLLLVDDHVDNLELLTVLLSGDYIVQSYPSAAEALRVVEAFKPDLLVLDVCMQPIDGVECLHAARAMPECSTIPAIALTALARDVDKAALLKAGFQEIVTKPILDQTSFITTIDRLVSRRYRYNTSSGDVKNSSLNADVIWPLDEPKPWYP